MVRVDGPVNPGPSEGSALVGSPEVGSDAVRGRTEPRMAPADELVDVVDETDRVVATVTRRDVRERGLLHRCTYVLVRNRTGDILVHRARSLPGWLTEPDGRSGARLPRLAPDRGQR
jgi:hypothetical protein